MNRSDGSIAILATLDAACAAIALDTAIAWDIVSVVVCRLFLLPYIARWSLRRDDVVTVAIESAVYPSFETALAWKTTSAAGLC